MKAPTLKPKLNRNTHTPVFDPVAFEAKVVQLDEERLEYQRGATGARASASASHSQHD